MRVIVLAPWRAAIVSRMVAALRQQGVEVVVVSHNAAGQKDVVDLGPLGSFWDYFKFGRLKKLIKEIKPDLIHAHYATHYGAMAAMQREVPFVVALWGSDVLHGALTLSAGRKAFLRLLLRFVVRRAAVCHSSAPHVCEEARIISGLKTGEKFQSWFWGVVPEQLVRKPNAGEIYNLLAEYNLPEKIILSGRGVSEIYSPREVAAIISRCCRAGLPSDTRFVVLRGNSSIQQIDDFKSLLSGFEQAYVLVTRMLNEAEMAYLYNSSVMHLSIPKSDSLGGGVVEPAMCGSFPIMSDLPGNRWFAENYIGAILPKEPGELVECAIEIIQKRFISKSAPEKEAFLRVASDFSEKEVISRIIEMYTTCASFGAKLHNQATSAQKVSIDQ